VSQLANSSAVRGCSILLLRWTEAELVRRSDEADCIKALRVCTTGELARPEGRASDMWQLLLGGDDPLAATDFAQRFEDFNE
jgi:hypothetical protein